MRFSFKKVGVITFFRIGRFYGSFGMNKPAPMTRDESGMIALAAAMIFANAGVWSAVGAALVSHFGG